MHLWVFTRLLQTVMILNTGVPASVLVPLPGHLLPDSLSVLTRYPYWFTYLYFKSKGNWVIHGVGNGDITIRTSTVTLPPITWLTIRTDLLTYDLVSVVLIAGPQCVLVYLIIKLLMRKCSLWQSWNRISKIWILWRLPTQNKSRNVKGVKQSITIPGMEGPDFCGRTSWRCYRSPVRSGRGMLIQAFWHRPEVVGKWFCSFLFWQMGKCF